LKWGLKSGKRSHDRLMREEIAGNITSVITGRFEMSTLKLTQIGNSVGVILPKELLARLKLEKGDSVFWTRRWRRNSRLAGRSCTSTEKLFISWPNERLEVDQPPGLAVAA
jgi:hypothetical protein